MKHQQLGVIGNLWEKGGLDMEIKELPTGLKIINATPHQLMFVYKKGTRQQKFLEIHRGDTDVVELLSVDTDEQLIETVNGSHEPVDIVYPTFHPRYPDKVMKALQWAEEKDVYFVSSILTAMAIPHKRIVLPITDTRKSTKVHLKTAEINRFSSFYKEV